MNFPDLLNFIFLFWRNTTHSQNPAWSCKTHAGGQIHQGSWIILTENGNDMSVPDVMTVKITADVL